MFAKFYHRSEEHSFSPFCLRSGRVELQPGARKGGSLLVDQREFRTGEQPYGQGRSGDDFAGIRVNE